MGVPGIGFRVYFLGKSYSTLTQATKVLNAKHEHQNFPQEHSCFSLNLKPYTFYHSFHDISP